MQKKLTHFFFGNFTAAVATSVEYRTFGYIGRHLLSIHFCWYSKFYPKKISKKSYPQLSDVKNITWKFFQKSFYKKCTQLISLNFKLIIFSALHKACTIHYLTLF